MNESDIARKDVEQIDAPPEKIRPEYEIKITSDQLSVFVRVASAFSGEDIIIDEADIFKLLEKNGIKYGIMNEDVRDFCVSKSYFQWHKVAMGIRAVDGEDGSYSLSFDPNSTGPQERDDGSVDYRELGLIKNVLEGEVLCNIVLPAAGIDGTNVFAGVISARQGVPAPVEAGKNVLITEDGTELLAETAGCVYFKDKKVFIEEAYSLKEDVSLKTGNVQFNGSIHIAANVLQGFKVSAQKDIYVKGRVEGAELTAGGNIVIVGGITGMNSAKIEAEGDITAKFIENATVLCGGNLTCDIILMSKVKVEKSIFMKGERAAIIGGSVMAGEKITARTLGSGKYPQQEVAVVKNWKILESDGNDDDDDRQKKDRESLKELKKKLAAVEQYVEIFGNKIIEENKRGSEKNISALKEYMVKKSEFMAAADSMRRLLDSYKKEDFLSSITCTGFVYPGVKIRIDNCWQVVTDEIQNQKFYVNEGEIVFGAVLPGEGTA